jgi:hypothetical protein
LWAVTVVSRLQKWRENMVFDFEKQAMNGEPLPKGLDLADSLLYLGLKRIYADYKSGIISRKEGSEIKETLVYNHAKAKSELEFLSRRALELSERIQSAKKNYEKNRTIENADALCCAIFNCEGIKHE